MTGVLRGSRFLRFVMGKVKIDPRIAAAKLALECAERDRREAAATLGEAYGQVLRENGFTPGKCVVPGTHKCSESPLGTCIYDYFEDPSRDDCLLCHEPEERK